MDTIKNTCLNSWDSLQGGFNFLWGKISGVLPSLIIALIVLVIGSWVSVFVGNKIAELIKKGKVDDLLDKTILFPLSKVLGVKVVSSKFVGESIKWVLLISVFIAVFDILGMNRVIDFFGSILSYLPTVFVATFIVVLGSLLANFVAGLITVVTKGEHDYLATASRMAINTLAMLIALIQLLSPIANAAVNLMQALFVTNLRGDILFTGVAILFVLAFRDIVVSQVKELYDEIKRTRSKKGSKLDEIVKIG